MPSSGHDVREYMAVCGCVRALTVAVVAVTVAIRDTEPAPTLPAAAIAGGSGLAHVGSRWSARTVPLKCLRTAVLLPEECQAAQ
jgi:hypothetical protein